MIYRGIAPIPRVYTKLNLDPMTNCDQSYFVDRAKNFKNLNSITYIFDEHHSASQAKWCYRFLRKKFIPKIKYTEDTMHSLNHSIGVQKKQMLRNLRSSIYITTKDFSKSLKSLIYNWSPGKVHLRYNDPQLGVLDRLFEFLIYLSKRGLFWKIKRFVVIYPKLLFLKNISENLTLTSKASELVRRTSQYNPSPKVQIALKFYYQDIIPKYPDHPKYAELVPLDHISVWFNSETYLAVNLMLSRVDTVGARKISGLNIEKSIALDDRSTVGFSVRELSELRLANIHFSMSFYHPEFNDLFMKICYQLRYWCCPIKTLDLPLLTFIKKKQEEEEEEEEEKELGNKKLMECLIDAPVRHLITRGDDNYAIKIPFSSHLISILSENNHLQILEIQIKKLNYGGVNQFLDALQKLLLKETNLDLSNKTLKFCLGEMYRNILNSTYDGFKYIEIPHMDSDIIKKLPVIEISGFILFDASNFTEDIISLLNQGKLVISTGSIITFLCNTKQNGKFLSSIIYDLKVGVDMKFWHQRLIGHTQCACRYKQFPSFDKNKRFLLRERRFIV